MYYYFKNGFITFYSVLQLVVFSKNAFSENTKQIKTSNRQWKKWNTDILASKGVFYHILKYGRFLLEHPLYKFSLNEFWPSKLILCPARDMSTTYMPPSSGASATSPPSTASSADACLSIVSRSTSYTPTADGEASSSSDACLRGSGYPPSVSGATASSEAFANRSVSSF